MKLLVTAFEPFGGSARNASLDTLDTLPGTVSGCTIQKLLLPVVFDRCGELIRKTIEDMHPDAVLCLGQAEGRSVITPEAAALNLKHTASPDNAGQTFHLAPILADGPDAYLSTLPVGDLEKAMRDAGIPAALSFTAGTYVCNNLLYHTLRVCRPLDIPAGFIHLPLSDAIAEQTGKRGKIPSLPQQTMTDGVLLCLRVLAETLQNETDDTEENNETE